MSSDEEKVSRASVKALDEILGTRFVIQKEGFVRVIDYLGSDQSIVQAARVSYGKGTKTVREDAGLIRYLMRNRHTSPFEMCELKLHVRVPMDTWRQWIRHRTASVNEYSTRYSIAIDATADTAAHEWRLQAATNRQGSGGSLAEEVGVFLSKRESELHALSKSVYTERLDADVAREQARKDLPLSTYTEAYWKVDLHNLFNFLELRMSSHAQKEISEYATIIGNEVVARWCPVAWKAFTDYRLHSMQLSAQDLDILRAIQSGDRAEWNSVARTLGWLNDDGSKSKNSRERQEFEEKLMRLGIVAPWK